VLNPHDVLVAGLVQSLPKLATVNESLFLVWPGYQDYFFSLYNKQLTVQQTAKIVPDVVAAIEELVEVSDCLASSEDCEFPGEVIEAVELFGIESWFCGFGRNC
jgi:hypothetical protein